MFRLFDTPALCNTHTKVEDAPIPY